MIRSTRNLGTIVMTWVFVVGVLTTTAVAQSIAWPNSVEINPPGADTDAQLAAFSGIWEGKWDGGLVSRLAVEDINADTAIVVYGWADIGNMKAGWYRTRAKVLPSGPTIEWGGGLKPSFAFTMQPDRKTIKGISEFQGNIFKVVMTHTNP